MFFFSCSVYLYEVTCGCTEFVVTLPESIACVAKCRSPVVVSTDRGLHYAPFRPRLHVKRNSRSACEQDVVRHDCASHICRFVQQTPGYGFSHRLPVSLQRVRSAVGYPIAVGYGTYGNHSS